MAYCKVVAVCEMKWHDTVFCNTSQCENTGWKVIRKWIISGHIVLSKIKTVEILKSIGRAFGIRRVKWTCCWVVYGMLLKQHCGCPLRNAPVYHAIAAETWLSVRPVRRHRKYMSCGWSDAVCGPNFSPETAVTVLLKVKVSRIFLWWLFQE
jgi:hypothetical protein